MNESGKATAEQIVEALRCSASVGKCKGHECHYLKRCSDEEIKQFCEDNNTSREVFTDDFWESCDCDQIAIDAADMIESLMKDERMDAWEEAMKRKEERENTRRCQADE